MAKIIHRDRIGETDLPSAVGRFNPIPLPYTLHIRERVNDDGTFDVVHRKRVYSGILGGCVIVDEEL